jgi:hypothetical protein
MTALRVGQVMMWNGRVWVNAEIGTAADSYDVTLYGAFGDGSTDDSDAIQDATNACAAAGGGVVYFPPGTYITSGRSLGTNVRWVGAGKRASVLKLKDSANEQIVYSSAVHGCGLFDLGFDGNNANQSGGDYQPVSFAECNNVEIHNIRIDRGTDGTKGAYGAATGLRVSGGTGHRLHRIEVTGDGIGYGIQIRNTSEFELVDPYVHDMNYELDSNPGNDRMDGIVVDDSSEFVVNNPRVYDLGGDYGSGATTRWTRGINTGSCSNFSINSPNIARVDQGIDVTGTSNLRWEISAGMVSECHTWAYKFANSARDGVVTGCVGDRCGSSCFVVSGPSGSGITVKSGDITFVGCVAYDPGYNAFSATHAGFRVQNGGYAPDDDTTLGVRFIGCRAHDRQDTPTMSYGFLNEVAANTDGRYDEAIDCVSIGHTVTAFSGMHSARCEVSRLAAQSIPDDTWTTVEWTAEVDLGAMHPTDDAVVYARRAGTFRSTWGAVFAANATGQRGVRILLEGSPIPGTTVLVDASAGVTSLQTSWSSTMDAGDSLRLQVFQDSGGALDLQTTSGGVVEQVS